MNEKEVKVPLCSEGGCTVSDLKEIVNTRAEGCDYNSICNVSPDDWTNKHSVQQIIIAVLLTISLCQATYIFFHCVKRCPLNNNNEDVIVDSDQQPLIEEDSDQGYAEEPQSKIVTTALDGQ